MNGWKVLTTAWEADPIILGGCVLSLVAYGVVRRPTIDARLASFAGGMALAALALLSPIGVLARGYLFSAHMLQHLILLLIVPPLLLIGWGGRKTSESPAKEGFSTRTAIATWALGVGAMWLWHAPKLCDAAASRADIQYLQTLSLLAMGGAFWWPVISPRSDKRLPPFAAMIYLFTACIACTTLGILVTFSPVEVCSIFLHPVDRLGAMPFFRNAWGLDAKADQEVGGLLMWVPACLVYAIGIVATLGRYYADEPERKPAPEVS